MTTSPITKPAATPFVFAKLAQGSVDRAEAFRIAKRGHRDPDQHRDHHGDGTRARREHGRKRHTGDEGPAPGAGDPVHSQTDAEERDEEEQAERGDRDLGVDRARGVHQRR